MPEPISYPGSPSLSAEARDKVLQTFRHTVQLARNGRNEEALLGCDFILKMDGRFTPARKLLEVLRGVAAGTVVDLSPFAEFLAGAAPSSAGTVSVTPGGTPSQAPPTLTMVRKPAGSAPAAAPAPAPTPAPAPAGPALPDLGFDDFAVADPFAAPPAPAADFAVPAAPSFPAGPAPMAPPAGDLFAAPPDLPSLDDLGFGEPAPVAPAFPPPSGTFPPPASPLELGGPFGAAPAAPAVPSPFESPSLPEPPAFPAAPFAAPSPFPATEPAMAAVPSFPAPVPSAPPPPTSGVDPRIAQFLRQGDEAIARGQVQEAIDLWSRVFLIDLSNEEASRRIDSARDQQAEQSRKVDQLLSEGIQRYESGDLAAARHKFLDVLAISETDTTARNYLNQIEAALTPQGATGDVVQATPDFMKSELEAPVPSSAFDTDLGESPAGTTPLAEPVEAAQPRRAKGGVKVNTRLLLAAGLAGLALIGGGAWYFLFREKTAPPATPVVHRAPKGAPATAAPAPPEDAVAKAQALFEQGKGDEALAALGAVSPTDPRHAEALQLIDKIKSSAAPVAAPPPPSAAQLDERRVAGLAAFKARHYLDAVKSLSDVSKARPEDVEVKDALNRSMEQVKALGAALKAFNESDYESAKRLLWPLRTQDKENEDVKELLFKSYFNDGVAKLQAEQMSKAAEAFTEAVKITDDKEAQRHLQFSKRYGSGATDLLAKIYVKHLTPRP